MHSQPGQVYAYRFDWDEEPSVMGYDLSVALGAAHGLEIAFVFGEFERGLGLKYLYPKSPARDALSSSMMSYWTEFAYSGDPAPVATAKKFAGCRGAPTANARSFSTRRRRASACPVN